MYFCEVFSFIIDIKKCFLKFLCIFYNFVYFNFCIVDFGLFFKGVYCYIVWVVQKNKLI